MEHGKLGMSKVRFDSSNAWRTIFIQEETGRLDLCAVWMPTCGEGKKMQRVMIIKNQWFCPCGFRCWFTFAKVGKGLPVCVNELPVENGLRCCPKCHRSLMKNYIGTKNGGVPVQERIDATGCLLALKEEPCFVPNV